MESEASESSRRKLRPKVVEAMRKFHLYFRKLEDNDATPDRTDANEVNDKRSLGKRIRREAVESRKLARTEESPSERDDYAKIVKVKVGDVVLVTRANGKRRMGLVRSRTAHPSSGPHTPHRYIHVHWMVQSPAYGQTNEWFLKDGCCDDVPLRDIYKITTCRYRPPMEGRESKGKQKLEDEGRSFWVFRLSEAPLVIKSPETMTRCDACRSTRLQTQQTHARPVDINISSPSSATDTTGISFRGMEFHPGDIVLIDSCRAGFASEVAQVIHVPRLKTGTPAKEVEIRVRLCERVKKDEARITLTNIHQTVNLTRITHKCRIVKEPAGKIDVSDFDVVILDGGFRRCRQCPQKYRRARPIPKLPSVDLYAGGGGTLLGADKYFKAVMAIDCDSAACETLRRNFPNLDVREAKLHDLHDAELSRARTKDSRVLPKRGEVFLLTACPPCQGHTGMNRFKSSTDWRVNEIYVTMSEIDRLRPHVVLLENVPGMLNQREDDTFAPPEGEDGIGRGSFAQAAINMLVCLGYQCRLAVLDSRSYGSPQNRQRVFILASRSGVPLPTFPDPSHANPRIRSTTVFTSRNEEAPDQKYYIGYGTPGTGPYPAVTVRDAISDLPQFEYRIPGVAEAGIPTFSADRDGAAVATTKIGFTTPVDYISEPLNRYQRGKRVGSSKLRYHYTPSRSETELKRIKDAFKYCDMEGNSSKLDPNDGFMTLLTNSGPGRKVTRPIHYSHRTLTVAERKRGQGVPDVYRLEGSVREQDTMLGNMVDVSMGEAIYAAIHKQIVVPLFHRLGRPDNFAESWRG